LYCKNKYQEVIWLNRREYLEARIEEINGILKKKHLKKSFRKNQEQALQFYKNDLFEYMLFGEDEN